MELSEDMRRYLGWGTLCGGALTAGVGVRRKSVPAAVVGVGLSVLGGILLSREVGADDPEPGTAVLWGYIKDVAGGVVRGARVTLAAGLFAESNANGRYEIRDIPSQTYNGIVEHDLYESLSFEVDLPEDESTRRDFDLIRKDAEEAAQIEAFAITAG